MQPQRQTAVKLWIGHIISSPYTKTTEEFSPHYITFRNEKISRVNIIANVIETFTSPDNTHASLTLDDGSGTIRIRAFKEDIKLFQGMTLGDLIMLIGKVREYNNEIYVAAEIVKKLELAWGRVRRLELIKAIGQPPQPILQERQQVQQEEMVTAVQVQTIPAQHPEAFQKVLSSIGQSEGGISVDMLSASLSMPREEVEKVILDLIKTNDVYQNKPGYYKTL